MYDNTNVYSFRATQNKSPIMTHQTRNSHSHKKQRNKTEYVDSDVDDHSFTDIKPVGGDGLDAGDLSDDAQERILSELQSLTKNLFSEAPTGATSKKDYESKLSKNSSSVKKPKDFETFYERSCKGFLQSKEEKIDRKRKQQEEEEIKNVTLRPSLIAKQQGKHIPLLDRAKTAQMKKNLEIEKIKREREEKEAKELQDLTFKPAINEISKALVNHMSREGLLERLANNKISKNEGGTNTEPDLFKPKINKTSKELAQNVIKKTSSKVEDRLLLQAELIKSKKQRLESQGKPDFVPKLNKTTQKIVESKRNKELTESRIDKSEFISTFMSNKRRSVPDTEAASIDIPRTVSKSPIRTQIESSYSSIKVGGLNLDNQLMNNLKQLTLLLQGDSQVPVSTKQSLSIASRREK